MLARYDGECPSCDGAIHVGDAIAKDEKGRWVCYECAIGPERADWSQRTGLVDLPICGVCHLQRPCWCPEAVQRPEDAADRALRRAKSEALAPKRDPWEGF